MTHILRILLTVLCGCTLLLEWGRCDLPKVPHGDITPPPLALNSNGWRPLLTSTIPPAIRSVPLQHPVLMKFQTHMQTAERNKRLQSVAPSNKVETYALAPPSILGSFSVFGHAAVKSRDKKKGVAERLVPPAVLRAESTQQFRYEPPAFYSQEPSKNKQFFPSQQIGEFATSYSTLGDVESFEPFYKTFSHSTTNFGDGDVKFLPQSVGIQVASSSSFAQPGQVQDVPLRPSTPGAATGPLLSDGNRIETHSYILPGSTPIASFDKPYVTTWPPAPPRQQEQYLPTPSLRPVAKLRPYFQEETSKDRGTQFRAEGDENPFGPTQTPSSQTYIRKPAFSDQTTMPPPPLINEVRLRKPLLPTPLTEEEDGDLPKDLHVFPEEQNEVRTHQSQRIRLPATAAPEEEEQPQEQEEQAYQPRRPVNRRPPPDLDTVHVRRPSYKQKQPANEGSSPQTRRPVSRNKPSDDEQKQRKRRPISEEVTTQPSATEPENTPPAPLDSSAFHSRKRVPGGRGKDRTRTRAPGQQTTESPFGRDDHAYDPELQSASHAVNEVTDDVFMSTKSGPHPTTTTTVTTTPLTTTSRSRLRFPSNTTRPRFSLKDHKERLERLSALAKKPAPETSRGRNRAIGSSKQEEEEEEEEEEEDSRDRVRSGDPQRGRQRPSTTTETPVAAEPSSTTERVNNFRPTNSRYRPGASKYYSGHRSRTTEAATDAETSASSTTLRTVVKSKPLFSVTRKPFPLRTRPLRISSTSTTTEEAPPEGDSAVSVIVTEDSERVASDETPKATGNDAVPIMSEKADTPSTVGAEAGPPSTDPPLPEQDTLSPSQIVADLTSSANSNGYFSKRTNLRITMATEDPILPIEAFFPVRSSREVMS